MILSPEKLNKIAEEKRKFYREHPEELERLHKLGEKLRAEKREVQKFQAE